jgi:cytochrome b561
MQKYNKTMVVLHWVLVLLFAAQFIFHDAISHAYRDLMRGNEVAFDPLVAGHIFGGFAILALTVIRFVVRKRSDLPPYPAEESKLTKMVSEIVHYGTYVLGVTLPISGAVAWFGGVRAAADGHEVMKGILMALVALHVAGALFHFVVKKNNIFKRMWF